MLEITNWCHFASEIHFAIFVYKNFSIDLFDIEKEFIYAAIPVGKFIMNKKMSVFIVLILAYLSSTTTRSS